MPLAPIESVGLVAVGAAAAASTVGAQSAKFAGLMRSKLRSLQQGAQNSAQSSVQSVGTQFQLPNGASVNVGQLRSSVHADLKQIQSRLTTDAAQSGINIGAGVTLQVDSNGVTHVLGTSQQQAAIESLVAADPQLDSLISSTVQKARVLHAAEGASGSGSNAQQSFQTSLANLSRPLASANLLVSPQRTSISFSQGE
jgi:hypothetical protein